MSSDIVRYSPKEFAALAGVTVRTLHHYDRLGLLPSRRTPSGHRRYAARDLPAIREIGALKSIGIPLRDIVALRHRGGGALADRIREQQHILEARQRLTTRLLDAIAQLDRNASADAEAAWLASVSEIVAEEHEQEEWGEAARATLEYRMTLSLETKRDWHREWNDILKALRPNLDKDPSDAAVQTLAVRWIALCQKANPTIPVAALLRLGRSNLRWASKYGADPSPIWRTSLQLLTRAAELRVQSM